MRLRKSEREQKAESIEESRVDGKSRDKSVIKRNKDEVRDESGLIDVCNEASGLSRGGVKGF
jgi:hypothetical protein